MPCLVGPPIFKGRPGSARHGTAFIASVNANNPGRVGPGCFLSTYSHCYDDLASPIEETVIPGESVLKMKGP